MGRFFCCAALLMLALPAHALNKCIDARGRISYQDDPCPGTVKRAEPKPVVPEEPDVVLKPGPLAPAAPRSAQPEDDGDPSQRSTIDDPVKKKIAEERRVSCERLAKDIATAKERAKPMWGEQRARLDQQIGKAEADYGRRCR
jgi:hypothetical protein